MKVPETLEVAFNMNPKGFIELSAFSVSFCNFFKILSRAHYSLWFTVLLIVKRQIKFSQRLENKKQGKSVTLLTAMPIIFLTFS